MIAITEWKADSVVVVSFLSTPLLPLVLRFRRRVKFVCDVVKGTNNSWFHCVIVVYLNPGLVGLHTDLHGFYKWVIDDFSELSAFIQKVVDGREDTRHQAWATWIWDNIDSHPFKWFKPHFVSWPLILSASLLMGL